MKIQLPKRSILGKRAQRIGTGLCLAVCAPLSATWAQSIEPIAQAPDYSAIMTGLLVGVSGFTFFIASLYWKQRNMRMQWHDSTQMNTSVLKSRLLRLERTLMQSGLIYVIWTGRSPVAEVLGDVKIIDNLPKNHLVIPKWEWLNSADQDALSVGIEMLRIAGDTFSFEVNTTSHQKLIASGTAQGADIIVCFRVAQAIDTQQNAPSQALRAQNTTQMSAIQDHQFFANSQHPAWIRDTQGQLIWVNLAYAEAVESTSTERVVATQTELLDSEGRALIAQDIANKGICKSRLNGVMASNRCVLEVFETRTDAGSMGMAINVTPYLAGTQDLERQLNAHKRTLEHIPLAVAVFGRDQKMVFANASFEKLWGLNPSFIAEQPTESRFLDHLREHGLLPEQADYKRWRTQHLDIYRADAVQEDWWHLPQGRTIRMIANPNPAGGVIYFYEDVTQQISIETQYNHMMRLQHETLEALTEGVVVFGSNGRLRLINPAFLSHCHLEPSQIQPDMRVEDVFNLCRAAFPDKNLWSILKAHITTINSQRVSAQGQAEGIDGRILEWAALPLPDGGTLLTFMDATAATQMRRALAERNEALEAAHTLKNDFIQHISYELRSPLTNVIGFTQLLSDPKTGKLNKKQANYLEYISSSSSSLLTIINEIIDLVTIDAGIMSLELEAINPVTAIAQVTDQLKPQFEAEQIGLRVVVDEKIGQFEADTHRLQQILTHLITNAVGFSHSGQMVTVEAIRNTDTIRFTVQDEGQGIAPEEIARVFDRFVTHGQGTKHRGVGLGLSIVKAFVELHKGHIEIESELGKGTKVHCYFPIKPLEVGSAPVKAKKSAAA